MQINQDDPETIVDHNLEVPQPDNSKRFRCEHCDFRTARSYDLKVHSRKHTGERLRCEYCDYTTTRSDNLNRHSRKHTGERLRCEHCDYTTTQSGNLKAHSRKHTGVCLRDLLAIFLLFSKSSCSIYSQRKGFLCSNP